MERKNKQNNSDIEYLKWCLKMSPLKRLEYLEELNKFLNAAMPAKSKRAWEKLKKEK